MFSRWRDGVRVKRPISRHLYDRFVHKYFAHDVNLELQLLARRDAARYIRRHMTAANVYADRWRLLRSAVGEARPAGLFLEFGVEKGASANFIARLISAGGAPAVLHAFDSFEGRPGVSADRRNRAGSLRGAPVRGADRAMRLGSWHRVAPLDAGDFPAGTPLHHFFAWNEAARHKDRRYVVARDIYTLFTAFGGGEAARAMCVSHLARRPLITARFGSWVSLQLLAADRTEDA